MSKKHYSQYFAQNQKSEEVAETPVEVAKDETAFEDVTESTPFDEAEEEAVKEPITEPEAPVEEEKEAVHQINAVVTAPNGVNMRRGTSTAADVVCVLPYDTEVYAENSNDPEWYYVETFTKAGEVDRIGFVMKKFILVD